MPRFSTSLLLAAMCLQLSICPAFAAAVPSGAGDDGGEPPGGGDFGGSDPLALHVPADYPTIQAAIDAASDGDHILVAPGTYTGTGISVIDTKGKAIWLEANGDVWDPAPVIDGQNARMGVLCDSGEHADTVIQGFQIVRCWGTHGGTVRCANDSSPTFKYCGFRDSSAQGFGGGVYVRSSSPSFQNCSFVENTAARGGGMYAIDSNATLTNCSFSDNIASESGGGLYSLVGLPTLTNCTLIGNEALEGGGMYCDDAALVDCMFEANLADERGGGIAIDQGAMTLTGCEFVNNGVLSMAEGGAISNNGGSLTLDSCELSSEGFGVLPGNAVTQTGGQLTMVDCLVAAHWHMNVGDIVVVINDTLEGACSFLRCDFFLGMDQGNVLLSVSNASITDCSFKSWGDEHEGRGLVTSSSHVVGCKFMWLPVAVSADETEFDDCIFDACGIMNGGAFGGVDQPAMSASNSTIRNCSFDHCEDHAIYGNDLVVEECTFSRFLAASYIWWSDDIYCHKGSAIKVGGDSVIRDCMFEECFSRMGGSTLHVMDTSTSLLVERCVFRDNLNYVEWDCEPDSPIDLGGGAVTVEGAAKFVDCDFMRNRSFYIDDTQTLHGLAGGAILCLADDPVELAGCTFCGNDPDDVHWTSDEFGDYLDLGGNTFSTECCDADFNHDGIVDGADLTVLLGRWGTGYVSTPETLASEPAPFYQGCDLNQDGVIDGADLTEMLGSWGLCPE